MRVLISFFLCLVPFLSTSQTYFSERKAQLDSICRSELIHDGKHPVHNLLLYTKNINDGFEYWEGFGIRGRDDSSIERDYQYKVASITKTFVATIVHQLIEEGLLDYNDFAEKYLSTIDYLRFDQFHIYEGIPYSNEITIDHLLRHTSGIGDIFTDKETRFVLSVLIHKKRMYNEEKVIKRYFKYKLHKQPTHKPGEGYHYSDMNYMLLGFAIEQVTGKSLALNIRERILEPLGMANTYFEYYEPVHGKNLQIDTYLNKLNVTKKVNTSYEWAGGGLVSDVSDMGHFIEALFNLKLFKNQETLDRMIDLSPAQKFGKDAGQGIFQYSVDDIILYGHGGYYGSLLLYCPDERIVLSIHVGQANAELDPYALIGAILKEVRSFKVDNL